jgi:sulfur carrier protein ThiS
MRLEILEVQLTLHGILRDHLPRQAKGKTTLSLPEGATVADVLQQFKLKQSVSAAVSGVQVERGHVLHDGDDLQLFRMIGGG